MPGTATCVGGPVMSLVLTPVEKMGSNRETEMSETRSDTDACSEGLGAGAKEGTSRTGQSGKPFLSW